MAAQPAQQNDAAETAAALAVEMQRLARYLIGATPTAHQIGKYIDFHRQHPLSAQDGFDRLLTIVARSSGVGLALADAYSGLLARRSLVRAKLIVALALLECSAPSFAIIDAPRGGYLSVAMRGAAAVFAFAFAALVLVPAQLWCSLTRRQA